MKKITTIILILAIVFSSASVWAQSGGTITLTCKKNPGFVSTVRKGLQAKVQAAINPTAFTNAKTRVRMRLVSVTSTVTPVNTNDLISSITVTDSGDPVGLAFAVRGDINLTATGACVYVYRVVITTSGRDAVNKGRLGTRTESTITFTTPPYGTVKRS